MSEKLIFPIGFDLEEGVRQVQKDWKKHQPEIQKTIDRNPLKLKLELSTRGLDIRQLKDYIGLSREIAKANREIAKTRSENALAAQRESRQRVQEATELDQIRRKKAQAITAEERATQAKQRSIAATERQNAAYNSQGVYLQRLIQHMRVYFSLHTAFSFLRNIREVTAEFELQRVALGSIIGDLNEADKMFEQIKAAAVKSPFQIKELVSYTKRLAAYKIETEDLFETTQRLADMSAGLGVGMERLVLAYGQIRATGYLRASEVRQLTEAGIPIVEELAKKMSQLRGETVSAAEVMGMISERAISFGMVKEVFDDMTSAGGMFYKMQEKQAETLAGQWSNLRDSIAIMYEEIGNTEGVNNAMKGVISLIKSLAENWRTVGNVVGNTAIVFASLRGTSKLLPDISNYAIRSATATRNYNRALSEMRLAIKTGDAALISSARSHLRYQIMMRNAEKATTAFERGLKKLWAIMVANPWTTIITALVAIGSALYSAYENATRLKTELAKIGTEGALQADQSVRNFERLAKTIRESADGSAKQTKALAEMKRTYGEFLPSQDKAITNLVREKNGYDAITQAIREKIAWQIQEQKLNTINKEYVEDIAEAEEGIKDIILQKAKNQRQEISSILAAQAAAAIREAISSGKITKPNQQMWELVDIIEEVTGKRIFLNFSGAGGIGPFIDLVEKLGACKVAIQEVEATMASSTGITGKYAKEYEALQKELEGVATTGEKFSFEWNESKTKGAIKKYNEYVKKWFADENRKLQKDKQIQFTFGDTIDFDALYDAIGDKFPQLKTVIEKVQKEYEKLIPKDLEQKIRKDWQDVAKSTGASMDKLQHYFKDNETSTQDWVKTLKDVQTKVKQSIFDLKKLGKDTSAKEAEEKALDIMIKRWEYTQKTEKTEKTKQQALKDELSAVEKIYKCYNDLREVMSATKAQKAIEKEFESVKLSDLSKETYSYEQMLEAYQKALVLAKALRMEDFVLEIQTKIGELGVSETQKKLEQDLKDLSYKLSRTKTAKEFFDRMLGLTGDKQLSTTLTMSVYGENADELGGKLAKQTIDGFKKKYKGVDFSEEAISDKGVFNWNKILEEGKKQKGKFGDTQYEQFLNEVGEGSKASATRIEALMKELDKTKTYGDKLVAIYTDTQERINKINTEVSDEATRERLKQQAKELQTKNIQKAQYDAFKESPMFVSMFENLDATSTAMLTSMRSHILKLQSEWKNLDFTQLKELQNRINEIDKQLATRNPFKGIVDGIKEFNALQESGSRKGDEQALLYAVTKRADAQAKYDKAVKDGESEETIKGLATELDKCVDAEKNATVQMQKWDDATQKVMQGMQSLSQVTDLVQTTTTAVNDIVEAFGGWGDAADEEFWNTILDGVNGLMSGVQSAGTGVAQIMAGDILGGATSLISGIGSIASSIGNLIYAGRIKRANKEIERQQELLDNLSYSYERLKKAQEKAFGSDYISNYEQRMANLEAQQEAYLKQAEAERSKGKKADADKIKEYEEQARATADAIKDMQSELSEYFLGTDLTSAARDFASAWIDAYKEFGSTTDAMKDKFQDMIQNMIVESFAARVIQTALQDIFDSIDDMTKDGVLDVSEASKIADMTEVAVGNIDVGMTNLMNALSQAGISVRGMGSELTGISRDIATASEESILGLAAGINTQNFYISQVPSKLDTIIGLLRGENAMQGSAITLQDLVTLQNQHLSYLPTIAQHTAETVAECKQIVVETRRTADALERVIKPQGTQPTHRMYTSL